MIRHTRSNKFSRFDSLRQAPGLLALLLSSWAVFSVVAATDSQVQPATLNGLCDSVSSKSIKPLKSISQVEQLIGELNAQRPDSCESYLNSFLKLKPILEKVQTGNTCNLELVDMLREYHVEFIDTSDKTKHDGDNAIPDPLKFFFISLCFQISAECKMSLINNLEIDSKEKIKPEDYRTIEMLEKYGATLLDKNTKVNDFDDIVLLSDINLAIESDRKRLAAKTSSMSEKLETRENKILVKVKTNAILKTLIKTCYDKFRPFYEKLILPLIALSNMGYNYQGELLAREIKELKENELIRRWYNIVQTCEAFTAIEIYEDAEAVVDDQQAITIISRQESELLKEKRVTMSNKDDPDLIKYEPIESHNSDELWIQDQQELEKLVNKYEASIDETERIKRKLMRKLFEQFKRALMSGKIKVFVSNLAGGIRERNNEKTNINEEMLTVLDEAVDQSSPQKSLDSPVAFGDRRVPPRRPGGFRGKTKSGASEAAPPRVIAVDPTNESKLTTKLFRHTFGKLVPGRLDMTMWFFGIVGVLLIILSVILLHAAG